MHKAMVGVVLIVCLSACASQDMAESSTARHETFIANTNAPAAMRRANEYARVCYVEARHLYGRSYQWRVKPVGKGEAEQGELFKSDEPNKVLARIVSEAEGFAKAKMTMTVLGTGRWDAAEIAAAKASIQSGTPTCPPSLKHD